MNENEFSDEEEEKPDENVQVEPPNEFTILENEYKNVLAKVQENLELAEIGEAYTKLFEVYFKTYTHDNELKGKFDEFDQIINSQKDELVVLKQIVAENTIEITDLKEKLQHSYQLADEAHVREQLCQENMESMRRQIIKLTTELEEKLQMRDEDEISAVNKIKDTFAREKQHMTDEISCLKQKLANSLSYSEEIDEKLLLAEKKIIELDGLLEKQTSEVSKRQRITEKLDAEITQIKTEMETIKIEFKLANESVIKNNKYIIELENKLREQSFLFETTKSTAEINLTKLEKCNAEFETANAELIQLKEKYTDIQRSYKIKCEEFQHLRNELSKTRKQHDNYQKRYFTLDTLKNNIEQERDKLRSSVNLFDKELNASKKQADLDRKQTEALLKEKDMLHKHNMRLQTTIDGQLKLIKIQEQTKRKLENIINNYLTEIANLKRNNKKIEEGRNKGHEENLELTRKLENTMTELKMKEGKVFDIKKSMTELETKLREQQNVFEVVRADRNLFQKSLQDTNLEMADLKTKYKISVTQIGQLKEDIAAKETLLLKEENILRKLNKEKEDLKIELQLNLESMKNLKHEVDEKQHNEKCLLKYIQELETNIRKQSKELEQLMNSKQMISALLVRRNDEISLLQEKIKILEITLNRGEAQYNQRIQDIKILKLEIKRLCQEVLFLNKSISNIADLKQEVFTLEKELAQEKIKCRALEDELQNPMNIHRWRILEESDPELLNLLQKIQILQKRLLTNASISIKRELQLKETEKLYYDLRQILLRQPPPNIKDELMKTQKALALRGNKMKCLISELNMCESQLSEYKTDLDKLAKELKDVKQKYFKQKKINEKYLSKSTKFPIIKNNELQPKFSGGGFKLTL